MSASPSYPASLQPFIVLDKNQFRGANAAAAIAEAQRSNCQVLVIDTVFVEIVGSGTQGKDWKDQFEKDFRDWTKHPELLAVSQGLGELLRLERDSGVPAMSSLVDAEMTNLVRNMVRDLEVSGIAGLTKYDARVAAQLAKLTTPGAMLDPVKNLAELHAMVDHWFDKGLWCAKDKEATKAQMGKEVRDKSIAAYDTVALAATSDGVLGGLEDALLLTNKGYTKEVAKHLMTTPSFTLFRFAALEALALYYYALGRKSAQITDTDVQLNQTLDTTYLGYGLACQQLRTAENLVRRLDAGLRRALSVHFP